MKNLEKGLIIKILVAVIVVMFILFGIYVSLNNKKGNLVGGDVDSYGCIGSAGYSWCEVKNKCLRIFEEKCEVEALNKVSTTTPKAQNKTNTASTPSLASKCGFTVTFPTVGSKVSFPLVVKGTIDNSNADKLGCSWNQVQSRAGEAQVFYNSKNQGWKASGIPVPIMTSSGLTASSTAFSVSLNMYTNVLALSSGTPIKIIFTELKEINSQIQDSFEMIVYLK